MPRRVHFSSHATVLPFHANQPCTSLLSPAGPTPPRVTGITTTITITEPISDRDSVLRNPDLYIRDIRFLVVGERLTATSTKPLYVDAKTVGDLDELWEEVKRLRRGLCGEPTGGGGKGAMPTGVRFVAGEVAVGQGKADDGRKAMGKYRWGEEAEEGFERFVEELRGEVRRKVGDGSGQTMPRVRLRSRGVVGTVELIWR